MKLTNTQERKIAKKVRMNLTEAQKTVLKAEDLNSIKRDQLLEVAKQWGLQAKSRMKKAEIIELLAPKVKAVKSIVDKKDLQKRTKSALSLSAQRNLLNSTGVRKVLVDKTSEIEVIAFDKKGNVTDVSKKKICQYQMKQIVIEVSDGGLSTNVRTISKPINRMNRKGFIEIKSGQFGLMRSDAYTTDLLSIAVIKKGKTQPGSEIENMFVKELYVHKTKGRVIVEKENKEGETTYLLIADANLEGSEQILTVEQFKAARQFFRAYRYLGCTPSELRLDKSTFISEDKSKEEFLTIATSGGYLRLDLEAEKSRKVIFKETSRFLQCQTGSTAAFRIKSFFLKANGTFTPEVKNMNPDAQDGSFFIFNIPFADYVNEKIKGINFDPRAVLGMGAQCRPWNAKVFGTVIDKYFATNVIMQGNIKTLTIKEIIDNPDFQDYIWAAVMGKDAKGKKIEEPLEDENGEVIDGFIICEEKGQFPEVFLDRNGIKLEWDLQIGSYLEMLDMPPGSSTNTSKQMLEKAFAVDPEKSKALTEDICVKKVQELVQGTDQDAVVPGFLDKSSYQVDLFKKVAPLYINDHDKFLYQTVMENDVKGLVKSFTRMKFAIEGIYQQIIADPTSFFGQRILNYGEAFSNDALKKKKEEAMLFRYPTTGLKEYAHATFVSLETIKTRIEALENVSKAAKKSLYNYFRDLNKAILVIPAYEKLKDQMSGCDFDFDAFNTIYNYNDAEREAARAEGEELVSLVDILKDELHYVVNIIK